MREDLRSQYSDRLGLLERLRSNLEQETKDALAALPHIDRVTFRVKGGTPSSRKQRIRRMILLTKIRWLRSKIRWLVE
jgi:hypothetical protein